MNGTVIAETLRRIVRSPLYILYLLFMAAIALASGGMNRPAAMWPSLVMLLAYVYGSLPIGPEFSSGTLQLILTKPVTRAVYLMSRVAGVVLAVWIAVWLVCACELLARLGMGRPGWKTVLAAAVNTTGEALLVCGLLVLFGALLRAYFNLALYFVLDIALSILVSFLSPRSPFPAFARFAHAFPWIATTLATIDQNLFPDAPPGFDRDFLILVVCNAVVAILLATLFFRRREVPYGAD